MKNKKWQLGLKILGFTFLLFVVTVAVHVYMVMQPKKVDNATLAMARLDFMQPITKSDSAKVTQWLYQQKGVQYVLCNPSSNITVIGFYPAQINASTLAVSLTKNLSYKVARYIPTTADLNSGCPIIVESIGNKLYRYIQSHL